MQLSSVIPKLSRAGSIAAAMLTALTIAWVILLVYPSAPASDASPYERLQFIADHNHWQTISFVVAALMAIFYVPLWVALAALIVPVRQIPGLLVAAMGILFSAVLVVGYLTQLTTVRNLDHLRQTNAEVAIAIVEAWEFSGNFWTASYGIVIVAFVLWGLTTLAVFSGLFDSPYGPTRTVAKLYGIAGILAITGALGFATNVAILEYGLILSGITSVPAHARTAAMLHRFASETTAHTSSDPQYGSPEPVSQ
jgi:hypothetical protein